MRPPRVAMIVHNGFRSDARIRRYVDAIVDAGGEVDVFSLRDTEGQVRPRPGTRVHALPLAKRADARIAKLLECAVSTALFAATSGASHLRRRFDVVHVHNMPDFLLAAAVVPRLAGARTILDVHDTTPEFYGARFDNPGGLVQRALVVQERLATRLADHVIAANDGFADVLAARGVPRSKLTVVRNIADPGVFRRDSTSRAPDPDRFTLVYPGTLGERFGLDAVVRGIALARERVPGLRVVFHAAPGPDQDALATLARQVGVEDGVVFAGLVDVSELPAAIAAADAGIASAIPDVYTRLIEPVKVLEYVAMGRPVIAARLPSLERMFPADAIAFFEPGDAASFAARVVELAEDPCRRARLVERADAVASESLSWAEQRERYLGLLSALTARPAGRGLRAHPGT